MFVPTNVDNYYIELKYVNTTQGITHEINILLDIDENEKIITLNSFNKVKQIYSVVYDDISKLNEIDNKTMAKYCAHIRDCKIFINNYINFKKNKQKS